MLAIHSIDEFVFSVPDLEEARRFYCAFGLDVRDVPDGLELYTFGHAHRWGRVLVGKEKRLRWLSFGIYAGDEEGFARRLERCSVARIEPPGDADPSGIWMLGPDDVPLQLRVAEKSSPSEPSPRRYPGTCSNAGRAPARSQTGQVRPLYLSHILIFSADVNSARAFYETILGFRLSDQSGSVIAFLHSPHGSDHHLLALALSSGAGLHHSSWCVPTLDDVGLGSQQMSHAGFEKGWGLGRHVLGSNYFRYVRDPWGSYAEYSFDIDFVEAGNTWPAADHPAEDSLYVWGPSLPDDFIINYEVPNLTKTEVAPSE